MTTNDYDGALAELLAVTTRADETLTMIDGKAAVRVPLRGKHGEGRTMILDADEWPSLRERWGDAWRAGSTGRGRLYVQSCNRPETGGRAATLSRVIMEAKPGEVVLFTNGDSLDLRVSNMTAVNQVEVGKAQAARMATVNLIEGVAKLQARLAACEAKRQEREEVRIAKRQAAQS